MTDEFEPDIWRLQTQYDTQGLVSALQNKDVNIRRRAAAALRAIGAYEALPQLEAALEGETDPEARSTMISAMATLKQEKQYREEHPDDFFELERPPRIDPKIQALIDRLNSDNPQTVIKAARLLAKAGDKSAVEPLVLVFNNLETSMQVRLAVAEALLTLESAPVEVALLGALRSENWRVRRNGAAILGQLGAEWAVEPLIRTLSDEKRSVRRTAYAALKAIGTPAALEALERVKRRAQQRQQAQADEETPPTLANDETQRIEWPRGWLTRTNAPTKPLDPNVLENSDHYQSLMQGDDDTSDDES